MATKTTNLAEVQKFLAGIDFPADKQQILNYTKNKGATGEVANVLNGLPDRQYMNSADISSQLEE